MNIHPRTVARGLAWFCIGLGMAEVLSRRAVARASRLQGYENLLRAFGVREIASGTFILASEDPKNWLWTRVAGVPAYNPIPDASSSCATLTRSRASRRTRR